MPSLSPKTTKRLVKAGLILCLVLVVADKIYKEVEGITYLERGKCIINQLLPPVGFVLFEYFVELTAVVFLGIFAATVLEKYFVKHWRLYPSNPFTAFLYASVLPVCACTTIPLVRTMQAKMGMRTIVAFIVAAPLLNPYIIVLSFSVLGVWYGVARIVASCVLAISAGYVVELFQRRGGITPEALRVCETDGCKINETDLYLKTAGIFRSVLPYIVAGGMIGTGLELLLPRDLALEPMVDGSLLSSVVLILAGIPFYFCNGTDVLLLRPLLCSGIPLGTGVAFSLTSTAICITSIFMLFKFMGRKLTFVLVGHVFVVSLLVSVVINATLGTVEIDDTRGRDRGHVAGGGDGAEGRAAGEPDRGAAHASEKRVAETFDIPVRGEVGAIAAVGETLYMSVRDPRAGALLFARSDDGGRTWRPEDTKTVDAEGTVGLFASIAVEGDRVYLAYHDSTNGDLKLARSSDGGRTWRSEDVVTVDAEGRVGMFTSVAVDGEDVFVSFTDHENNALRFARSRDRGATWASGDKRVVDKTAVSKGGRFTSLAVDGDNLYIVFSGAYHGRGQGRSLRLARSRDRGQSWDPALTRIIDGPECTLGGHASLIFDGERLLVAYVTKDAVKLAVSEDGGDTWPADRIAVIDRADENKVTGSSSLAVVGSDVLISYEMRSEIRVARSRDGGATWDERDRMTLAGIGDGSARRMGTRRRTTLVAAGSTVHLLFGDEKERSVQLATSDDRGATWRGRPVTPEP